MCCYVVLSHNIWSNKSTQNVSEKKLELSAVKTVLSKTDATSSVERCSGSGRLCTARRLVGWGLTALLTQNRSYRACRFVGIFYSKL